MEAADNKEPFENQWRQAFEQASVNPPPMVWHKIEATLATQKEGIYKKAIFYYQFAAAAMAAVAVGLGAALFFVDGETHVTESRIASESVKYEKNMSSDAVTSVAEDRQQKESQQAGSKQAASQSLAKNDGNHPTTSENRTSAVPPVALGEREGDTKLKGVGASSAVLAESSPIDDSERSVAGIDRVGAPNLSPLAVSDMPSNIEVLNISHLYGVARPVIRGGGTRDETPLLASIGVGAGSFDPNYSFRTQGSGFLISGSADRMQESVSLAPADKFNYSSGLSTQNSRRYSETYNQGGTFSFGAGVGKRLFKKLLVHAGLYYGRFNSSGSTNLVLSDSSNDKRYAVNQSSLYDEEVQDVYSSGNYSYQDEATAITNTYEFLTVPLKVGYVLLDGRTGVVLNTGIASEFFLSNIVKPDGSGIESTKTTAGADSPYRNVYFNGTLGIEVNYQVASNYKVVLEPYYRHALTTFTKNTEGLTSSPRIWGIQAGLRYELR